MSRIRSGLGQVQQIGVAGELARMVGEARAAVVLRLETGVLEHRAPGAVEHEDPLRQQLPQTLFRAHSLLSPPCLKRTGAQAPSSLGVF